MLKGVSHIGVAVNNLAQASNSYVNKLGAHPEGIHEVPGIKAQMLSVGNTKIELLEAIGTEGPIAKFLQTKGEGIHHICLEVDNIDEAMKSLSAKGVTLIDKVARQGIEGRVAFIHPKDFNGVLVELVEVPKESKS